MLSNRNTFIWNSCQSSTAPAPWGSIISMVALYRISLSSLGGWGEGERKRRMSPRIAKPWMKNVGVSALSGTLK